jgi:hypothetical protein
MTQKKAMGTPTSPTDPSDSWSHLAALIARGGHVTFGRIAPIEGAAVAADEHTMLAALVRRNGESIPQLLRRLNEAVGQAATGGIVTNEVNGGKFALARTRVRKKR